ncbi:integral membrane protein [Neisseria gonorrhoeae]|uniref:Integral membrane protein n=1 Tax=Neisseria gonorrhoeae TaxID=485 RepID=A0A378W453_NEIGO|nr:integral membrane protein [Neisseria gonorrhoeae]
MTRTYKYSFSTFFITIQALTSLSLAGLDVYAAMPVRIIDTIIGASLAWAAVSYLWPDWKYLTLERTAALAVCSSGTYLQKIAERLKTGETGDDIEYRITRRRAHEHTAALSSTLSDMSSEPAKFADSLQPGFTLLKTGYALTGYISALGAYRSEMHEECSPDFTAQFHLAAEHTAHIFQHLPDMDPTTFRRHWIHCAANSAPSAPAAAEHKATSSSNSSNSSPGSSNPTTAPTDKFRTGSPKTQPEKFRHFVKGADCQAGCKIVDKALRRVNA